MALASAPHVMPSPPSLPEKTHAPTLALVLIARNESRSIERCLNSARPWVDRMVVLDTGSTDTTVDLARACGAEVHRTPWTDDFSAARNHVLGLASADWNLVLDADEWIESGGESLRNGLNGPPLLGVACVHSEYDAGDATNRAMNRSWMTRLLPRGVRYQGRVHEQVASDLPRRRLDLHIGHDGYRDAQMATKRRRNRPLLMKDLADHPNDPYILYQLGKDTEVHGEFALACVHYAQAATFTPRHANWRHELSVRRLHCLGQAGRRTEALVLAESQMSDWPDSPDFFFTLGNLLLDQALADPAQAMDHWLPLAESAWLRCLEIGERPDLEGSVQGRGSHLARHNLDVIRSTAAHHQ